LEVIVRRRITLAATAVAGVSLVLAVGIAPAVGKPGRHRSGSTYAYEMNCSFSLTTMPPPNSTAVVAPTSQGAQYGGLKCGQAPFYGGAIGDTFTVPDSGDTVGNYTEYLNTGTIRGSFDLTPQEGTFGNQSFQSQSWTGTISVTSGTGAFNQITSAKHGTMNCSSPDSVHLSCNESILVRMPAPSGG
jgi:hypothetical protein